MILGILNTLAAAGLAYLAYLGANFPFGPTLPY
jgi:hypothetical protein